MRGFLLGALVGLLAGSAGTYLILEKPWRSNKSSSAEVDAGVPVATRTRPNKRKRWRGRRTKRYKMDGKPIVLNDHQKALIWKGAVRKPAQNADFSSEDNGRTLSNGEVNRTLGAQSTGFLDCIRKARGNAVLSATITLKMLVNGKGRPTQVAIRAPRYLFQHGFGACATAAARAMQFAAVGKHTVVTAPYTVN